jgi:hypothetical protein
VGRDVPDIISGSGSTWKMMEAIYKGSFVECKLSRKCTLFSNSSAYYYQATVVFPFFCRSTQCHGLENNDGNGKKSLQIGWASDVIDGINGFGSTQKSMLFYANKINALKKRPCSKFGLAARESNSEIQYCRCSKTKYGFFIKKYFFEMINLDRFITASGVILWPR